MSSKFNIGSVIYDATTGTEQGAILHDGVYTSTSSPTATDTLLIKQAGVQKQIAHGDLGFIRAKATLETTLTSVSFDIANATIISSTVCEVDIGALSDYGNKVVFITGTSPRQRIRLVSDKPASIPVEFGFVDFSDTTLTLDVGAQVAAFQVDDIFSADFDAIVPWNGSLYSNDDSEFIASFIALYGSYKQLPQIINPSLQY